MSETIPIRQNAPWSTQNQPLAIALLMCGIPPADPRQPLSNIYDAEHPFVPDPNNPRMPARRGMVEFHFENSDRRKELVDIFNDEVKKIAAEEAVVKSGGERFAVGLLDVFHPEFQMRFAARVLSAASDLKDAWRFADPKILVRKGGESQQLANGATSHPGFILVSRNASPETLAHLGIKPEDIR